MKISVLLATNRINNKCFGYIQKCINGLNDIEEDTFTHEFKDLIKDRLKNVKHFLEPTLRSLEAQSFKEFELVISHRYPEDAKEVVKGWSFPIKLVKEKHSIWHDLGDKYHTVANNKNTAFINSKGELIYHIDDLTFFNENLLQEAWDLYCNDNYVTGKTVRCITYDKKKFKKKLIESIGPNKNRIQKNGWKGEAKPLTKEPHMQIPMSMFWTCSTSVSSDDLLEINGYDEIYDGSLCGIDMDAGNRLSFVSKYNRVSSETYLYEIDDPTPKNIIRDDVMMRQIFRTIYVKANSWKPTFLQIKRYERWHKRNMKSFDRNWNKFMNVPLYDIKRERNV